MSSSVDYTWGQCLACRKGCEIIDDSVASQIFGYIQTVAMCGACINMINVAYLRKALNAIKIEARFSSGDMCNCCKSNQPFIVHVPMCDNCVRYLQNRLNYLGNLRDD